MDTTMRTALNWLLTKQDEYLRKTDALWEIKHLLGPEIYEKCKAFYYSESRKYGDMARAIERYAEMEGAEGDLVAQLGLIDIPTEAELEEARKAAENAVRFYQERSTRK